MTETISRTDEGQPRPKYIFNKCGTNIYFFLLYRGLVHPHPRILNHCKYSWRREQRLGSLIVFEDEPLVLSIQKIVFEDSRFLKTIVLNKNF